MKIMIKTTIKGSNQNNITSIKSTRRGYFSHYGIIGYNLFGGFGKDNNNNNLLSLLEFEKIR